MAVHRKLTAIMFTDIQGYTAMMQEDEETTIGLRNRHREIFETLTKKFRGNIVQYFGDGTLTAFDSSIDAVECALELQKAFLQKPVIPVRIGIHVGDIVFYENDIAGDAVNIASRIESMAKSGAVFFSGHVNDQLSSHKKFKTKYLDVFHFKNVKEAVPVFVLVDNQIKVPDSSEVVGFKKLTDSNPSSRNSIPNENSRKKKQLEVRGMMIFALVFIAAVFYLSKKFNNAPEENSSVNAPNAIAILPVQNLSGTNRNDMFCESISNELLQQLTGKSKLGKVVPNSLVNDYLERGETMKDLTDALGVRYILEGALHHSDSLHNLDMRLVDALELKYLWSDRYEHISETNYIAEIQSTISEDVRLQIRENSRQVEQTQKKEVLTDNKNAHELLLRANALTDKMNKESFYQALPLYEKTIQLDPDLAEGYMGLGRIYVIGGLIWGIFKRDVAATRAQEYLQRSMALKPTLEASQFLLMTKFFFEHNFQYADDHLSLVAILPPFPDGGFYAVYCNTVGQFAEGIRYTEKYVKRFPESGSGFAQMIRSYFLSGQIQKTDSLMNRYDAKFRNDQFYVRDVAMVHLNRGNMEAFKKMNQILKMNFLDNASVHLYYDTVALTYDGVDPVKIQERLNQLEKQYNDGMAGSPAWFLAMYYLYIGDDDSAFEWLRKSLKNKEVEMVWFKTEYLLQSFRKAKDSRYMAIYKQMDWP
jgi:class 3 adenylate cyclase/TolB-like protein